jgi:hypothetical protein
MRVRAIRSHFVGGRVIAVGEVYEIQDHLARGLIETGKSEVWIEPVPQVADTIEQVSPKLAKPKPTPRYEVTK